MELFFTPKGKIPEGLGFTTFGLEHLLWLVAFGVFMATVVIIYRKASPKMRKIVRVTVGVSVVACEIIKDVVSYAVGDMGTWNLPLHLCGISILLIAFDLIKQTKTVRNFLYYIGIPGAMLAIIFPNWTVLPCMNFFNIHSFVVHALIVLYPLILVTSGEIKPTIKSMPLCVALLVGLAIPIYFVNLWLDTNFMFLMNPETGNPLGLFEQYLGSHLWGFPILLPIVMLVMYLPILIANKIVGKKKTTPANPEKHEVKV